MNADLSLIQKLEVAKATNSLVVISAESVPAILTYFRHCEDLHANAETLLVDAEAKLKNAKFWLLGSIIFFSLTMIGALI